MTIEPSAIQIIGDDTVVVCLVMHEGSYVMWLEAPELKNQEVG